MLHVDDQIHLMDRPQRLKERDPDPLLKALLLIKDSEYTSTLTEISIVAIQDRIVQKTDTSIPQGLLQH